MQAIDLTTAEISLSGLRLVFIKVKKDKIVNLRAKEPEEAREWVKMLQVRGPIRFRPL
jgi:hypothetical protein